MVQEKVRVTKKELNMLNWKPEKAIEVKVKKKKKRRLLDWKPKRAILAKIKVAHRLKPRNNSLGKHLGKNKNNRQKKEDKRHLSVKTPEKIEKRAWLQNRGKL